MIESNIRNDLETKIDDYLDGKLSPKEIDELWVELIQDDYYLDYMKSVANLKKLAEEEKDSFRTLQFTPTQKWMSAVAAVLLLVGSIVVFNLTVQSPDTVQPISTIELDYYRSAEGAAAEMEGPDMIRQVITAANQGNVEEALRIVDAEIAIATSDDQISELLITAGSILYNNGMYLDAINRFESALQTNSNDQLLRERAYWYLGNSYFQLNKIDEAKDALERAYEINGAYSRVAQSYLKALSTS